MRNFLQTKSFQNPIAILLLLLFSFSTYVYAEGSKDLYPNGAQGYRAYLLSSTTDAAFNPFSNPGRMYIYAKSGETIYVGSSMQGMSLSGTTASIQLKAPNGDTYTSGTSTTVGRIQNRSQELIGPNINNNGGYNAYTRTVTSAQEGIWEINFTTVGYGTNISSSTTGSGTDRNYTANGNWVQEAHAYSASLIAAWDVSVGSSGTLISGRAYTTVFNGTAPNTRFNERSFYAKFYVLTPEGFVYLVDNNGQNGASFNFFSNNKGVMTNFPNGGSAYVSLDASDLATVSSNVWDPRQADNGNNITNKLFFNKPATDLPTSASIKFGSNPTATTWLKNTPVVPQINNLKLVGFEANSANTVGPKGSIISFTSNISGQYRIYIDVDSNGSYTDPVDVTFIGDANANEEVQIHWDGKDNFGNLIPNNAGVTVRGVISVSEVHFPFIDVESNWDGFIIQQTDHTNNYTLIPGKDIVYWNDSPTDLNAKAGQIASNPRNNKNDGISSNSNGHKWSGIGSSSGGGGPDTDFYGNNRTIDTWTFVESVPQVIASSLIRHIGDLAVNSVTSNVNTATVCADTVVYTIEIENISGNGLTDDAEGAKFFFDYPDGFEIWNVSYSTIVGTTSLQNGSADITNTQYSVLVDIKNGSKGLFTIKGRINPPLVANSNIGVKASILRPADFEDINATDINSTDTIPTDPQDECDGLPSGVGCNNIVSNNAVQTVKCPGPTFLNCLGEATCVNPENSGFKSEDPASLSYDNVISVWHSSAAQWVDGTIKVWGEYTGPVGNSSKNPSLVPTSITPGNGYNYTGEPVMIAMASMWDHPQFILLTSDDKLWAWGWKGVLVNSSLTPGGSGNSERDFRQLTIGLPTGVSASDVKMLFGTVQTLALTTCSGEVYVLSQNDLINQGGGSTDWVRVQYSNNSNGNTASGYLENIIATRGTSAGLVALDENGDLWTWGYGTRLGNNTTVANRTYAVKMTRPKAGTIKMIGAMKEMQAWSGYTAFNYTVGTGQNQRPVDMTYYVLYQDGALYALGGNRDGQIGNFSTTTTFDSWQQPRYASGGGTSNIMNNIAWISPQEHSYNEYPMINVISRNNNGEVWNWGQESGYDLGRGVHQSTSASTKVDPGMPTQFTGGNNDVITVESGSHTTMLLKKCNNTFGYIGHKTNGSMGDGSTDDNSINPVQFESNVIDVCGLPTVDGTLKPKLANYATYCNADLIELIGEPVGGVYSIASVDGQTSGSIFNSVSIDQNGMLDARNMNWGSGSGAVTQRNVRVYYELPPSSECAGAIVQVLITVENCKEYKITIPGNIWIDENEDAILDNSEGNLGNSNIWANLVNPEGEVIGQANVNADGTYEIEVSNRDLSESGDYQVILTKGKKTIGSNLTTGDQAPDNTYYTGTNRGTTPSANTNNTEGVVSIGNLNTYYTTNSDVTVDEVNFGVAYSKLSIKKTSDVVNGYMAGDTITYRIVVKNNDDFIHNSVKLTDTLPTGVTYVTNSTNAALGNNQIQVSVQHTDTLSGSSAGSFVVPNGVTSLTVQAWAGGGSGGSRSSGSGAYGGGGGGGMSESTFNVSQGTYYYSVGAGAAGNSTSAGDDTWFATTSGSQNNNNNVIVRAKGGSSVANNSTSGANGGTSSTSGSTGAKGDIRYAGGNGANASGNDAGGGGSSAGVSANGVNATNISGATAPTGGGNGGDGVNVNADGNPGFIPGGGGGGARRTSGTRNGGAGADGQIIISYSSTTTQIIQGNVGSPSVLASDWSILPGDSLVVTYKVVVNNPAIDSIYNKASATSNFVKTPIVDDVTDYLILNTTNAVNDENSTWVNTPVDGNVMTNDFDKEGDVQVFESFIKQDGSGTPISGSGQGTLVNGVDANGNTVTGAGYLKFDGNGNYTFTPINDFVGTVSVPYTIKDKDNPAGVARDTAVLEITVSPLNTKENSVIANNDEYYTQGSPVESNILINDADPQGDGFTITEITYTDVNGSHTVSVDNTHPVNNIPVSGIDEKGNPVDVAGHLSLDENGNMVFTPENGFAGTVTYDYEITDDNGNPATDNATVVITVVKDNNGPKNDPPFAGDDFSYTDINTPVDGGFIDNDGDLNDDPVYMTKEDGTKVIIDPSITEGNKQPVRTDSTEKGGTITYYDNGTYTYNPPKDYVGPDRSVYGICDSTVIQPKPLCAEATVHVLVGGKNSTNAVNDENSTWVNTPVDGNVMTNDFDKEGDVQVFESFIKQDGSGTPISGSGQGTLVNGVDANGNTVTGAGYLKFDANGNYTFTPINDFVGTVSVPYTIKDKDNPAGVARDTAILEITVSPKPTDANSIIANNDEYHTKGSPVESNILINDADPQGDGFTITEITYNDVNGSHTVSVDNTHPVNNIPVSGIDEKGNPVDVAGHLSLDENGNMVFTPENGFAGTVTYDYEITDDYTAQPAKDKAQVVITVERPIIDARGPENNPPHAGDDFSYTTVNTPVKGNFVDNDSDPDDNPIYMTKENGTKVIIDPSITEGNKQPVRTDSTEKGGTITYYDNGTYTYNPPKDYVGPDRSVYGICDSTVIQPKPLCTRHLHVDR
ncbi:MAG: Ig-like domain-containing protein [Chitinophagales bacterium]|nr:Ig-like domain-containing protein [Chitinophagales bacterium]